VPRAANRARHIWNSIVVAPPGACAWSSSIHLSRVPHVIHGARRGVGREQVAQCPGMTPASPHRDA
jgi:hypothetical protein